MSYVANLEHTPVMVLPLARLWQVPHASALPLSGKARQSRQAAHGRHGHSACHTVDGAHRPPLDPIARPPGPLARPRPWASVTWPYPRYRYYVQEKSSPVMQTESE